MNILKELLEKKNPAISLTPAQESIRNSVNAPSWVLCKMISFPVEAKAPACLLSSAVREQACPSPVVFSGVLCKG